MALSFICVYVFPSSLVILCFYFTLLNFFLSFYCVFIPLLPIFSLSSSFLLLAPFSSFHIPLLVLLFLNSSLFIYFTFYRHLSPLFLTPYLFLLPFSLFSFLIHRFLHLFSRHSPPSPSPLSYLAHNSISTFLTFPIFFLCYLSLQLFYLPTFPSLHKFFTALASPSFPLQSLLLTPDPAPLSGPSLFSPLVEILRLDACQVERKEEGGHSVTGEGKEGSIFLIGQPVLLFLLFLLIPRP